MNPFFPWFEVCPKTIKNTAKPILSLSKPNLGLLIPQRINRPQGCYFRQKISLGLEFRYLKYPQRASPITSTTIRETMIFRDINDGAFPIEMEPQSWGFG